MLTSPTKSRKIALLPAILVLALALAGMQSPISATQPQDGSEGLPPGTSIDTLLTNMLDPVAMAFDPSGRLFYTEKSTGKVRLFANGTLQPNAVITYNVS